MKRALRVLTACFAVAAAAAETSLPALAPAEYSAVISVDVRGMLSDHDVQKLVASPSVSRLFAELEDAGLRVGRVRKMAVFHWDDNWYCALRLDDAAHFREVLERRCAGTPPRVVASTVRGQRVYRLSREGKDAARHRSKELCVTFFGPDTALVAKFVELDKFLAAPRIDPAEAGELARLDSDLRGVYRRRGPQQPAAKGKNAVFDIRSGTLELHLSVNGERGISITGTADFADPSGAKTMRMTLPGLLAFFSGLVFAEDPEGGDEFVRALRSRVSGNTLYFSLELPEPLLERFLAALESFFREKKTGGAVTAVPFGR